LSRPQLRRLPGIKRKNNAIGRRFDNIINVTATMISLFASLNAAFEFRVMDSQYKIFQGVVISQIDFWNIIRSPGTVHYPIGS
jgi:hypothetical protein